MAATSRTGRLDRKFWQLLWNKVCWVLIELRFAKMVYEKETQSVMQRLWDETMTEFRFAEVSQILEDLQV
jgi:hypothetical protein